MERQAPHVYIENVEGYVYNVPLVLTYTHKGKEKFKDLKAGIPEDIGSLSDIEEGTALVFSARGTTLTATPLSITKEQLVQEYIKIKGSSEGVLYVTISSSGLRAPYSLTATYKPQLPEKVEQQMRKKLDDAKKNILTLFPRIVYWKLESVLSEDAIIKARSWQDVLVPEGLVMKATTAEDVFRYILEIPGHLYTQEQIMQAFRDRSKQWHPDKVAPENRETANRVFILLRAAQEGLLKAITEKPELQSFNQKEKDVVTDDGWMLLPEDPH